MHLVGHDTTFDTMFDGFLVVELRYGGKLERVSNPGTMSSRWCRCVYVYV